MSARPTPLLVCHKIRVDGKEWLCPRCSVKFGLKATLKRTKRRITAHLRHEHRRDGRKLQFYVMEGGEESILNETRVEQMCREIHVEADREEIMEEASESGEEEDRSEESEESGGEENEGVDECETNSDDDGIGLICDKDAFSKLAEEAIKKMTKGKLGLEKKSVVALQTGVEASVVEMFTDAQSIANLGPRPSGVVKVSDIQTVMAITEGDEEKAQTCKNCHLCKNE
ncbi:hypothetical protein CAEBREN_13847 [Caenorhabditis brenneri]|uniref:Uncharacterized protein n=1 Tax=Caenorhabditis brenneri TaxID=135651 RepID=G0PA61_CAEBE|nr:hypothetical protein CAEBREN_13847 [Caenorhabditis brenneri]